MRIRCAIERLNAYEDQPFDQQVWPVTVALGVSCALAVGAVATLMDGVWMWTMLLLLPALAAAAHFALLHMDDSKLKRSLQLAVLTSLSAHLAILIFTSAVSIFHGPEPLPVQKVVHRQSRSIEVTRRSNPFPWQKIISQPIPEPDIKVIKQDAPQTDRKPQTLPTVEFTPTRQPQLVHRKRTRKSVPRFSESMSALKRSVINTNPETGAPESAAARKLGVEQSITTSTKSPGNPTTNAQRLASRVSSALRNQEQTATTSLDASSSASISRRPTEPASPNRPTVTISEATTGPTAAERQIRKRAPHAAIAKKLDLATAARPSSAPKKRLRDIVPLPTSNKQISTSQTAKQPNARQSELSAAAGKITRRPQKSDITSIAPLASADQQRSPTSALARSLKRRTNVLSPTISSPDATPTAPRRSTSPSLIEVTIKSKDLPSRRPGAQSTAQALSAKPTALTRSTRGTSGIGKSTNVSNATGGIASPAARASDSAKREREFNLPNLETLMATSRKSKRAHTHARSTRPTSSLRADTVKNARLSGARKPKEHSLEAAAAEVASALAVNRDLIAAAKGEASADLGAKKIVVDHTSKRRSGGGLPDIGPIKSEPTKRSSETADAVPSLLAEVTIETAAPSSMTSQPTRADELRPNELAKMATHRGGEFSETMDFVSAIRKGAKSDSGENPFARLFSDQRSSRMLAGDPVSRLIEELLEEEDEKLAAGNRKTLVTQALLADARAEPVFTDAQTHQPNGDELESGEADALADSLLGKIARRTVAPSSVLGSTATRLMLSGATSLPVIQPDTAKSSTHSRLEKNDQVAQSLQSTTGSRLMSPQRIPNINSDAGISDEPVTSAEPDSGSDADELASLEDIRVDRMTAPADFRQDVDAPWGSAGLGKRPDLRAGSNVRPSSQTSLQIKPDIAPQFERRDFGGMLAVSPDVALAKEAFRQRSPSAIADLSEPSTEAAIHLGLEFLARNQKPDGSWALSGFDSGHPLAKRQLNSDTAATGLALLAFQGGGYNHREYKYAAQLKQAVDWLVQHQGPDGGLYLESDRRSDDACRMYSHGIATLALTEAYGMTQDQTLREPAQKAIDYLAMTQHPQKGGWRYFAAPKQQSTDTSVSGWIMMAIQSAQLADLNVDPVMKQQLTQWLDVAADPNAPSTFRYNPYAVNSQGVSRVQGLKPSPSMTSVGLLMRIYSGWDRNDPRLLAGTNYLLMQQLPNMTTRKTRDTYYWYYATQVLKHVGGAQWNQWNSTLRPMLIDTQERKGENAGSWHPYEPVPDRWATYGGRLYVTTMNLLSLEVRHRLLPLYRKSSPQP